MREKSNAHKDEFGIMRFFKDGLVTWSKRDGFLKCDYCGSLHPSEIVAGIKAGATGDWADWKYGWPHKSYFGSIPNTQYGQDKFYSVHLMDATPEEKEIIENHLGIKFTFLDDGRVSWILIDKTGKE